MRFAKLPFPTLPLPALPKPKLPRPSVAGLVRHAEPLIPFRLKKAVAEQVLNRVFSQPLADEEFYFLEQRCLGLEVKDLAIRIAFSCDGEKLVVQSGEQADAWIKGEARDLLQLANRQQDPDTLFFQRRLLIEGDTELSLAVKNLLDSIDWSELPPLFQQGMRVVQRVAV
ncbi:ubiquinone anaerobic biosynthesis accessory factor UbiT [Marinobacterium arenosum]|uniref:ubiquinone anaerobic biosynthesis accessory factor UbiT n=1 Tax=Marinobacterium arenosum TaxID=2862496 RepID=UPI001C98A41C|nr:SCP2 sterol-binding domain-containing protein [Marinobacterium arenosum]MBY4676099.1 SCP2 sterol-binding domain-containing protein [Marinobacterium arenosum]